MKPIGIIGGMGPEATILLMQKVLRAVEARDDADHIPLIVHQNPAVPSRIAALIDGVGDDPAPVLRQMAQDLQASGATALAMPCNTAHHYAQAVRQASDLPFLDMIAETTEVLRKSGARRIGMLASPAVRMAKVFDAQFATAGLEAVFLTPDDGLLTVIRAVKAGRVGAAAAMLPLLVEALIDAGADHLLIACTELSMLTQELPETVGWTDSLDCLVARIALEARG